MKSIAIIFLALIYLTSCKDSKSSDINTSVNHDTHTNTEKAINSNNKTQDNENKRDSKIKESQEDWYWKNTIMSKNNSFDNWQEGAVELVMLFKIKGNDMHPKTIKVGTINASGEVNINLPSELKTERKLDNLGNLVFSDITDISNFNYENGNTGYFSNTSFQVLKNGNAIGNLTMGNSVRTTYNLTNQSNLTQGDEGYLVYLVYVDEKAAMKGNETTTVKARRDGTNTIDAETTVVYNLNFKPGWNYVKTEVIGRYNLEHERGLDVSWFKKHEHTTIPNKPLEAEYFFRKNSY